MGGRITRWAATLAAMAGVLAMGACAGRARQWGRRGRDGRQGAQLADEDAPRAGDAEHPRRGRQPAADPGDDREVPRREPEGHRSVTYTKATAPELAGKIKAQQKAGRLHRPGAHRHRRPGRRHRAGAVAEGAARVRRRVPKHGALPAARREDAGAGQGAGITVTYYPSGPLLEYQPAKVTDAAEDAEELLAWAKANPGKFMYARPANSGPGRTFLMGLPYMLGDKDPKDPVNGWDKTWAYLKELNQYVDYYPSGTTDTMKKLANGSPTSSPTTTGWDINPRVLGTVPKESDRARSTASTGSPTRTTPSYRRVSPTDKLAAILELHAVHAARRSSRRRPTTRATSTRGRRSRVSTVDRRRRRARTRSRSSAGRSTTS